MLVIKTIVELDGGSLTGVLLLSDEDGRELWTFDGRQVLVAVSLSQHRTVPLSLHHLEKLLHLDLIDEFAMRRLICAVVK